MRWTTVAVLVLAFAAMAPVAGAQTPTPCVIAADAPALPPALGPDETTEVALVVRNTGSVAASVTVTSVLTGQGWTVSPDPAAQTISPQGSGTFSFTVSPAVDAEPTATLQFSANAACDPPTGPLPVCPGNACTATASQQVALSYRAPAGLGLPFQVDFPIEYLIAGILLVAVATAIPLVLRARKPRGGLAAECPEPLKMLKAGRGTTFPIDIRNLADRSVQATFEVGPVPEGWSAFMPLPEVQLAAKESRSLWLMVRAPAEAKAGSGADIELRMRGPNGHAVPPVRVRAEVNEAA